MRSCLAILVFSPIIVLITFGQVVGQSQRPLAADEYIQSSTPMNNGERLFGRTVPGSASQKMVAVSQQPMGANVTSGQSTSSAVATDQANRITAQRPTQSNTYPYPVNTPPRTARLVPSVAVAAATQTVPNNAAFRQTAYQYSGLSNNGIRTAQNCNCAPGTSGGFQVPTAAVPNYNFQAAPVAAPQGRLYVPGTSLSGQAVAPPAAQVPQLNYGQANCCPPQAGAVRPSWYQPLVAGTGVYQPLFGGRPMPAGTYLGQGIIGQPTAYVAGQTVRNWMRYLFP